MKKVFYFSPYLLPSTKAAGVRSHYFIQSLKECYSIHAVSEKELWFKLPTNHDGTLKRLMLEILCGVSLFFKVIFSRAEIYVFSSPPFFTVFLGAMGCIFFKKKYVLDIRDIYPDVFVLAGLIREKSFPHQVLLAMASLLYRRAKLIVTVTQGLVEKIEARGGQKRTKLIYNGFDEDLFYPTASKFDHFTLVSHGTLGKFQNIELIVELAQKLLVADPEIRILIIGAGPKAQLLENAPKNLKFLGELPFEDLGFYVRRSHIGLSLRKNDVISIESFPVKLFEYLGSGLHCFVAPKGEASKYVVESGRGELIGDDADLIVKSILQQKRKYQLHQPLKKFTRQEQGKFFANLIKAIK